jgi:hypothetical protein
MIFCDAASDIRYLLDRGYPQNGAVSFVCNHYRLDEESRHLLSRGVLSRAVSGKRKMKFLPCDKIKGNNIVIDGYNIIIGMESILEKKAFLCDDGVVRDIKGVFRNFKTSENTGKAIGLILQFLKEKTHSHICFLLDSQVSRSGLLARTLREEIANFGLNGDAMTSKHVDYDLKHSDYLVASSDGVIIDDAGKVVNFLFCIISRIPHLESGVGKINEFRGEAE